MAKSGTHVSIFPLLIGELIPSDFFAALSQNSVPAVALFCIFYGIAFQYVKDKQAMLTILDGIRQTSFTFWSFIVTMVPLAVFALLADTAQVQNPSSFQLRQGQSKLRGSD